MPSRLSPLKTEHPGDVEALARVIYSMVVDREQLYAYCRRAREFVEKRFSLDTMLNSFERIYNLKV